MYEEWEGVENASLNKQLNIWMKECMNEWMNEWIDGNLNLHWRKC